MSKQYERVFNGRGQDIAESIREALNSRYAKNTQRVPAGSKTAPFSR
jgi:hypothetical protein